MDSITLHIVFLYCSIGCFKGERMSPHQTVWLLDLDNTLHNASRTIFPALNQNMNTYMAALFARQGVAATAKEVDALRQQYWQKYGATLSGLVKHHQVEPTHFLQETHQFDDLSSMIHTENGVARLLRQLPGKKIILTNAPLHYTQHILTHLVCTSLFDQIVSVESMHLHGQFQPKPSKPFLRHLIAREQCRPSQCILVDDTLLNLKAAKQVGLKTVWMTGFLKSNPRAQIMQLKKVQAMKPVYVDVKIHSIHQLRHLF